MNKNIKIKLFPLLVLMTLIMSQTLSLAVALPDVVGMPYEAAVSALVDKKIITGDTDGNYYPDSNLTRAQFCTIIVKAMQAPVASVDGTATQNARRSTFPDLSGYGWAEGYISYAVEKGVVKGYPDGTFRPGNRVTLDELITMTLRAAAYTDSALGGVWPDNFIAKATELGAFRGLPSNLPDIASKWIAAQFVYNMLSEIEKANPVEEDKQTNGGDEPPEQTEPVVQMPSGLTFISSGKFDGDILTFAGKDISSKVQIQTYKLRSDYKSDMKLSDAVDDYMEGSIYKYKNVQTPAWYLVENNKVTKIILPNDVGFTGFAYSVINNIVTVSDGEGNAVSGFVTLSAGRPITWLADAGQKIDNPGKDSYLNGTVFELRLRNGKVMNIAAADGSFGVTVAKVVKEMEPHGFSEVVEKSGTVLKFNDSIIAEIKEKASVYYFNKTKQEYTVASVGDIRRATLVRLFDVSDDKEDSADLVVIQTN